MSGPPQLKSSKEVSGRPQNGRPLLGECGGHVGAPAAEEQ